MIEEVIDVAEGELKLVETMAESKAYVVPRSVVAIQPNGVSHNPLRNKRELTCITHRWEELEEKPLEGQWSYFARDQHTPGTQEPPK